MKAALLTRYDRTGASSRLRLFQYSAALRAQGVDPRPGPFFDDAYLSRLYAKKSVLGPVAAAYLRRFGQLRAASHHDLIWLEKEALPWLPWAIEKRLLPRHVPLVVDYDDAVFHRYDRHRTAFVRRALGDKLDRLMASADLVTAGNRYLADRAEAAGAKAVAIVPTVVDLTAYPIKPPRAPSGQTTIGWIGTPSTWTEYVQPMLPSLLQVATKADARLLIVGGTRTGAAHPALHHADWTEDSEVARLHDMDIGLMPLTDTLWARGKCGYKLIQYMACGLPVIASPVGVNVDIVEDGVNGFLATTPAEWAQALHRLIADPDLRAKMGQAGRQKVERHYSLQSWGPRVAQMLQQVAAKGRSPQ